LIRLGSLDAYDGRNIPGIIQDEAWIDPSVMPADAEEKMGACRAPGGSDAAQNVALLAARGETSGFHAAIEAA
jgi:hypothetical protein